MGGIFSKPKSPKLPTPEKIEEPQAVTADEEEVKRRKSATLQNQGRQQNILAGIQNVLKKKLGE